MCSLPKMNAYEWLNFSQKVLLVLELYRMQRDVRPNIVPFAHLNSLQSLRNKLIVRYHNIEYFL